MPTPASYPNQLSLSPNAASASAAPSGNIINKYNSLRKLLINIKYTAPFDVQVLLAAAPPSILLPIISHVFLSYSPLLTSWLLQNDFLLTSATFNVAAFYAILNQCFHYHPALSQQQFISEKGFVERKLIIVSDLLQLCIEKNVALKRQLRPRQSGGDSTSDTRTDGGSQPNTARMTANEDATDSAKERITVRMIASQPPASSHPFEADREMAEALASPAFKPTTTAKQHDHQHPNNRRSKEILNDNTRQTKSSRGPRPPPPANASTTDPPSHSDEMKEDADANTDALSSLSSQLQNISLRTSQLHRRHQHEHAEQEHQTLTGHNSSNRSLYQPHFSDSCDSAIATDAIVLQSTAASPVACMASATHSHTSIAPTVCELTSPSLTDQLHSLDSVMRAQFSAIQQKLMQLEARMARVENGARSAAAGATSSAESTGTHNQLSIQSAPLNTSTITEESTRAIGSSSPQPVVLPLSQSPPSISPRQSHSPAPAVAAAAGITTDTSHFLNGLSARLAVTASLIDQARKLRLASNGAETASGEPLHSEPPAVDSDAR